MKDSNDEQSAVSLGERKLVLAALFAGVFVFGISFAGINPWMALVLDGRGIDPTLIGIVSAANPVGVMVMAPFVARIMQRTGAADAIILGTVIAATSLVLMPLFDSPAGWMILRFISGLGGAIPWVATEMWINAVAFGSSRGRVIGLYGALMSGGFAVGPLALSLVESDGWMPVVIFATFSLGALAPVLFIRHLSPRFSAEDEPGAALQIVTAMPAVFAAGFLAGLVDTAFFTFLPIWGLRMNLDAASALALLSVFATGNIGLQVPIGWLADRIGTRPVMALCGLVSMLGPIGAIYAAGIQPLLYVILFFWGGAVWALYTLAMTEIGHRCSGPALATASGALVVVYTVSNISGPPLTGAVMQVCDPHGLMAVSATAAALFLLLLAVRGRLFGAR
jgi:MFS family permease